MAIKLDAATEPPTVFPAKMSTMAEEFHRQQSRLAGLFRFSAFSRTYWLTGFVGAVSICVHLLKIPRNHQIFISFAVGGALGILLNLLVILMHLLLRINESKLNKTHPPPSHELIEKTFHSQSRLMTAILFTEALGFSFGAYFLFHFILLAVLGTFLLPSGPLNPSCSTRSIGLLHHYQTGAGSWLLFWFFLKPVSSTAVSRVFEIKV